MSAREVTFFLNDRPMRGVEGEPVAKALFRAGIRVFSYSVKYRRPRSIHCGRGRCVMCHMEIDGIPGVPTCIMPLTEGTRVRREDFRPFFAPLLVWAARLIPFPAGFYYRMFTRPTFVRRFFLGTLRRMAGVGRLVREGYGSRQAPAPLGLRPTYDIVVVGAGLSGSSAALAAAAGAEVLLVDEYAKPGGHTLGYQADTELAAERDRLIEAVESHPSITHVSQTTAQAFYRPDTLLLGPGGAVDRADGANVMRRVSAPTFIFATGAYDIVPLFENGDAPGVFGSRAIRLFLERDGIVPGRRAVIYGTPPWIDDVRSLLAGRGVDVRAIVDPARDRDGSVDEGGRHTPVIAGTIRSARARTWLRSVEVLRKEGERTRTTVISCDLLVTAFRGQGAYELAYQAGFAFQFSRDPVESNSVMLPTAKDRRDESGTSFYLVGELAGEQDWMQKVEAGRRAGETATRRVEPVRMPRRNGG